MISRRRIVIALGAGALAAPFGSLAQQRGKVWCIGMLTLSDESTAAPWIDAFNQGMQIARYAANTDYIIEIRSANGEINRFPALAAELVARKSDLLITSGTPQTLAAMKATKDIPIVFANVGDPIGVGIVTNLGRPAGNVTGFSNVSAALIVKRLELVRELLPKPARVGFLFDPNAPNEQSYCKTLQMAAKKFGIRVIDAYAQEEAQIAAVFDGLVREKAQAVIVAAGRNTSRRATIAEQATKRGLPTVFGNSESVEAGGLMSYGADFSDQFRRAASYVARIFKGTKPGDLPIQQPTKFELVVNMKTSKALGIKIPQSILLQATKVIE